MFGGSGAPTLSLNGLLLSLGKFLNGSFGGNGFGLFGGCSNTIGGGGALNTIGAGRTAMGRRQQQQPDCRVHSAAATTLSEIARIMGNTPQQAGQWDADCVT